MLSHCIIFLTLQHSWSSFLACELDLGFYFQSSLSWHCMVNVSCCAVQVMHAAKNTHEFCVCIVCINMKAHFIFPVCFSHFTHWLECLIHDITIPEQNYNGTHFNW